MQNPLFPLNSSSAETSTEQSPPVETAAEPFLAPKNIKKHTASEASELLTPNINPINQETVDEGPKAASKVVGTTLRSRLLQTILPTVLIPLVVASFTGYRIINARSEERLQTQLENQALLASEASTAVLDDLLDLPRTVANSPLVINEARAGSQEASAAGLDQVPIDQLEAGYADTKLLRQHTALNTYLQQTVETAEISEILVTDKHGFNVAFSRPAADLVQRDEAWWQNGKDNEQWIGPPDFDFASRGFTVELVQSIQDPQNNDLSVGMSRAVLPTRKFSLLADTLQRTGISGSQRVQLIDGDRLSTIDTFSAQGFHKDRNIIGGEPVERFIQYFTESTQEAPTVTESVLAQLISIPEIDQVTLPVADETVRVASFVSNGRQFKVASIASSNWVAIASMDNREISASGRDSLIFLSLVTLLLGAATTAIIFWLSRQLSKPIDRLTRQAEIAASGNLDIFTDPAGTTETRFLTRTFNQLVGQAKDLIQSQSVETQKVQLFSDITSAPIFDVSELSPLLARILPSAREILGIERLSFCQVPPSVDFLNPNSQSTDRLLEKFSVGQKAQILAESVGPHMPTAETLIGNVEWLPDTVIKTQKNIQRHAQNGAVSGESSQCQAVSAKPFAGFDQPFAGLYVPVFYKIESSESSQPASVLWGYLIAHSYQDNHEWGKANIRFLERLALQLTRVLDRLAAGEVIKRSHQEVKRSRQATEAVTRN